MFPPLRRPLLGRTFLVTTLPQSLSSSPPPTSTGFAFTIAVLLPIILARCGRGPLTPPPTGSTLCLLILTLTLPVPAVPPDSYTPPVWFAILQLLWFFLLTFLLWRARRVPDALARAPAEVSEAREQLLEELDKCLLCFDHAGEHVTALMVVLFGIGEDELHVFQEVLTVTVGTLAELSKDCVEIHRLRDNVQVVLSLVLGHRLSVRNAKRSFLGFRTLHKKNPSPKNLTACVMGQKSHQWYSHWGCFRTEQHTCFSSPERPTITAFHKLLNDLLTPLYLKSLLADSCLVTLPYLQKKR